MEFLYTESEWYVVWNAELAQVRGNALLSEIHWCFHLQVFFGTVGMIIAVVVMTRGHVRQFASTFCAQSDRLVLRVQQFQRWVCAIDLGLVLTYWLILLRR